MELAHELIMEQPPVTVLHITGRVDGSNYLSVIEQARLLLQDENGTLLLDLAGCDYLSSAGLFALHNIALMAHHIDPLDQEDGWSAMREMANERRELKDRFKIISVPANITHTLEITGLLSLYAVYPDTRSALADCAPIK